MYLHSLIHAKRIGFADWLLPLPPGAKTLMTVSDEAWFYLTLPINKQNDRTWSKEKPLSDIKRPQKILKNCFKKFVISL